jgi:CRP-like cAMP-binding protein
MTEHIPRIDQIKLQIRELLRKDTLNSRMLKLTRHDHVYTSGQRDEAVYLVESGMVKILLLSPEGKECLIDIRTTGEIFGELSLCGQTVRLDTAVAMEDAAVKQISSRIFLSVLRRESLLEGLVQYLAFRVADQQRIITSLLTANSEQRLAMTLLRLARKLGRKYPQSMRIEQRISHSELGKMVGTTRTRIGVFLKRFREFGLISLTPERHLIVKESRISWYLARLTRGDGSGPDWVRQPRRSEAAGVQIDSLTPLMASGASTRDDGGRSIGREVIASPLFTVKQEPSED